jgi:hypothetical protein
MVPFSRLGAEHFCSTFSGQPGSVVFLRDFYANVLSKKTVLQEGDGAYELYRDALLREVDRSFFFGISCFRRALDLFTASSTFWAHVSLYYSSWFTAHAIVGMFGCWVGPRRKNNLVVIEAAVHAPGSQQLNVAKNHPLSLQNTGSHQRFWDAYYQAMTQVVMWTEPELQLAVIPILNSPIWAIEQRNTINYQTETAFDIVSHFKANFRKKTFPNCLYGETRTQYELSKSLLLFASARAKEFRLKTDVFQSFGTRAEAIEKLVFKARRPSLIDHSYDKQLVV